MDQGSTPLDKIIGNLLRAGTPRKQLATDALKSWSVRLRYEDQDNPTPRLSSRKGSYGLKQAPRAWYDTLSKFLLAINVFKGAVDPTTHDLSTSTYDTISFESKWKMEWLNSTSWKQTINWQISSQKLYQESVLQILKLPPRLGMKSLTPETLKRLQEGEDE
ncbi:hypothetical protein Tco_1066806 [Tanacetum coccineum]|uniref:Reverse transcriptase Ty1/copia-type domain-containing protein n=1 Tax=Tanacetum coccineum TaxID=301880 RepID=A0ABQ5HB50_9ASTR